MRAMMLQALGGPADLRLVELADPAPGPGEVLVDVRAAACNFADILMCRGEYQERPPLPFAPGGEVAGFVAALGEGVTGLAVGDRVLAQTGHGGFASAALAKAAGVWPIPATLDFPVAAGLTVTYQTAWFGLVHRAGLQPGETLLVHAAAGGVGLAAVQLGKALGARVLGTAGSPDKCALAREHGADEVFNYREVDWVAGVKAATGGGGADVIYDPVGGDIADRSLKCIAFEGRLLVIGFASGRIPQIPANHLLVKNISAVGLYWGSYMKHAPAKMREAHDALVALVERGAITPLVSSVRPLEEAAAALADLGARHTVGKVVLTP